MIQWDGRKWPDRPHWRYEMTWLGEDAHGTWFKVPRGAPARRGTEPPVRLPFGHVCLVPREGWWSAEFYTSHPQHEIYVNIGTPCEWHPGRIRQVDLDLDVIRSPGGSVETLDEDEFADHQVRYAYPPHLIEGARRAVDEVTEMLECREEPFDRAASTWLLEAAQP